MKKFAELISTFFYIGKIKIAPGTFGSLPAFPICYLILQGTLHYEICFDWQRLSYQENQILTLLFLELAATAFLFFLGWYCAAIYIKDKEEKDPKEVVIDEVVGQMLTIILSSFSLVLTYNSNLSDYFHVYFIDFALLVLMPFVLFRIFDIIKPWPIKWLDKNIKGALGIMIDDIAASIFAIISQYVIIFIVLEYI